MVKKLKQYISQFYAMTSIYRKSYLLSVLMLLSIGLLGALTWQAVSSSMAHREAARGVARDYATLAVDEFQNTLKSAVGYWVIHQLGSALQDPTKTLKQNIQRVFSADRNALNQREIIARESVDSIYLLDSETRSTSIQYGEAIKESDSHLNLLLKTLDINSISPYKVIHQEYKTFILIPLSNNNIVFMRLDNKKLSAWFKRIYDNADLIPESLQKDTAIDDILYIEITSPYNQSLFNSHTQYDESIIIGKKFSDNYEGLFSGYEIHASISPQFIPKLVIGGLPGSQLPLLYTLMTLTLVVITTTFWIIIKEHKLNRLRSEFIANASHELRTPITQIRMYAETILLGRVKSIETQHSYLRVINRESIRLSQLLDCILSFSKQSSSAVDEATEYCDVNEHLMSTIDEYRKVLLNEDSKLVFSSKEKVFANINTNGLRQIIINIIDNANKYGPAGQTITISSSQKNNYINISISDQGPGIPPCYHNKIWKPFYRLPINKKKAINGNGIGLSIVNDLIRKMNGKVSIENNLDCGVCFTISLPLPA